MALFPPARDTPALKYGVAAARLPPENADVESEAALQVEVAFATPFGAEQPVPQVLLTARAPNDRAWVDHTFAANLLWVSRRGFGALLAHYAPAALASAPISRNDTDAYLNWMAYT